jgi:hypothetical protein
MSALLETPDRRAGPDGRITEKAFRCSWSRKALDAEPDASELIVYRLHRDRSLRSGSRSVHRFPAEAALHA